MYGLIVDDVPGTQYNKIFIWSFTLIDLLAFVERYKIDDWQIYKRKFKNDELDEFEDIIIASSIKSKQKLNEYWSKKNAK